MNPLNAITFKALKLASLSLALINFACGEIPNTTSDIELVILGVSQDAGRPHIACIKSCCINPDGRPKPHEPVIALGVTDGSTAVLIEATPDLPAQWNQLKQETGKNPEALFITHAHIGHYTGLMYLAVKPWAVKTLPSMSGLGWGGSLLKMAPGRNWLN